MTVHQNVKIGYQSLAIFGGTGFLFLFVYLTDIYTGHHPSVWNANFLSPILYLSVIQIFLRIYLTGFMYDVAVRSTFLGYGLSTGVYISCLGEGYNTFGIYVMVMSFFHYTEFFITAVTNPQSLSIESFLLNHSLQYFIAAASGWTEWTLEMYFVPGIKKYMLITLIGLFICICGEFMRKGAMLTAKSNFNHYVQTKKNEGHILVKHGLYSICRHPSYVGWFLWSIGTQIILLNPICTVCYSIASWMFFNERIYYEEYTLLQFFGSEYVEYQKRVPTGLPFIKGFAFEFQQ